MRRRILFPTLVLLIMGSYLMSCVDIMGLSDKGKIESFAIKGHFPEEVLLGSPELKGDTVMIPLEYGRYFFPLTIDAVITCTQGVQVMNLRQDSIVFESPEKTVEFYLRTEGGLPLKRILKIKELPRSGKTDIVSLKVKEVTSSAQVVLSDSATIFDDETGKRVILFMPIGGYPISFKAEIIAADSAEILDFDPNTPITLKKESDTFPIKVRAANGSTQEWMLSVVRAYEPSSADYVPAPVLNVLSLNLQDLSSTGDTHNIVTQTSIDAEKHIIYATVKNNRQGQSGSQLTFPLSCTLNFPVSEPRLSIGYQPGTPLVFESAASFHSFYLLHATEFYKRKWTVRLKTWQNDDAALSKFAITKSAPASIELGENIQINHEIGSIVIPVESGKNSFPLSLTVALSIPQGAKLEGATAKQIFSFADLYKSSSFKIVAEDGTSKEYTIKLRYAGELNTAADIESFKILEYTSQDNRVKLADAVRIDQPNKIIEIEVLDWSKFFPLRIKAHSTISFGAKWVTEMIRPDEWITFDNINATSQIQLRSEDDQLLKTWTIKFKNSEPVKGDQAKLIDFSASGLSGGFSLSETRIDQENKIVELHFSTIGGSLSFTPAIQASPNAKLDGINDGVKLNFGTERQRSFYIVSQDESTRQLWTIKIVPAIQLTNFTLDAWESRGGLTQAVGWSSANNSTVSGTSSTSGVSGNAALLSSQKVDVVIVKEMAAGSLFLGWFNFSIGLKDTPKKMTYFGVPFDCRPKALNVDLNYLSTTLTKVSGSSFVSLNKPDKASVTIQLIRWRGTGNIVYHDDDENRALIDILGEGKITEFDDTDNNWVNTTIPIDYKEEFKEVTPTHIHVVFSTSYRGDFFEAGTGSKLKIDNVKLVY